MSTSSSSAESDLSTALPSCSYEPALCPDVLDAIFSRIPHVASVADALKLRRVNRVAARAISRSMRHSDSLKIDVRESNMYKVEGLNRIKLDTPEPIIYIEGTRVAVDKAVGLVQLLLSKMRVLRRLEINIDDGDATHLNRILEVIVAADNVQLEVLRVRRRQARLVLPLVVSLVKRHSKTLRIVGRLGLTEAASALSKQMNLERLSLMTFDLGLEAPFDKLYEQLLTITSSGAVFKHLSYTSFVGFDPTDEVYQWNSETTLSPTAAKHFDLAITENHRLLLQNLLATGCVESLRLTMVKGPRVFPKPDYMIGKVRRVKDIQLGEVVDRPNIFNSLVVHEKIYRKVFPHVDDVHYFQHWKQ